MFKKSKLGAIKCGANLTNVKNDAGVTFYFLKSIPFIGNLTLLTNLSSLDLCHDRD